MGQDIREMTLNDGLKKQYTIPFFQREYSWDEEQIDTLIKDIKSNNGKYCLGIITIKNNELIDGQQRLTTLYLIAIWCGFITGKDEIKLSYELDSILGKTNRLMKYLHEDNKKTNDSTSLSNGWKIVKRLINEDEKFIIRERIKNNLFYYEIELDSNTDLNHYFEVMNSRGLQLSRTDIVKSLLMKPLGDDDRARLNYLWYEYENMDLNYNIQTFYDIPINFKSNTKSICDIIGGNGINEEIIIEDNNNDEEKSILDFEYFLLYVIRLYCDINNLSDELNEMSADFDLSELLKMYTLLFKKADAKKIINFINFLIETKNIYDMYIVKNINGSWEVNAKSDELILIQSCMRVSFTSKKSMHWLYLTLRYWKDNKQKSRTISNYVKGMRKFIREKYVSEFIEFGKDKNYYTGFSTQHIILNYLDYLLLKNQRIIKEKYDVARNIKFNKFTFQFRNSIEHFMPRNPENMDPPEWVDDFGNLALLVYGENTRIQNPIPINKAEYFNHDNRMQSHSLKLQLMSFITLDKGKWESPDSEQLRINMIDLLIKDLNEQ